MLNDADISLLLQNETVAAVLSSDAVKTRFRLPLSDAVKEKLKSGLGLDLFSVEEVPMMYIRGDMAPHVDSGVSDFKNTYLVYLTDSGGKFVVGDIEHDIKKGFGFKFLRGLVHETTGTGDEGRLMIGPLNDMGVEVGGGGIVYYLSYQNAMTSTSPIAYFNTFTVTTRNGISAWLIASNSDGTTPGGTGTVYNSGDDLISGPDFVYNLFPAPANRITYYASEEDAYTDNSYIAYGNGLLVETKNGISAWKISVASLPPPPPILDFNTVYYSGDYLPDNGFYFLYPAGPAPCFLEGSTILCLVNGIEAYVPIEKMRPGTLVKTRLNGFKPVDMIGHSKIYNSGNALRSANRLYTLSKSAYPELTEDLVLTGYHSILVDTITDTHREQMIEHVNRIFVTDKKYRLLACVDERAQPYAVEGVFTIWHLALENDDYYMNYGIWANGLLVETTSKRYMKELSGMTLV